MKIIYLYILIFLNISNLYATRFIFVSYDSSNPHKTTKDQRMIWTKELNALFNKVRNELEPQSTPKIILDEMKEQADETIKAQVNLLKRTQVASHLQKIKAKEEKEIRELEKLHKEGKINIRGSINAILN